MGTLLVLFVQVLISSQDFRNNWARFLAADWWFNGRRDEEGEVPPCESGNAGHDIYAYLLCLFMLVQDSLEVVLPRYKQLKDRAKTYSVQHILLGRDIY